MGGHAKKTREIRASDPRGRLVIVEEWSEPIPDAAESDPTAEGAGGSYLRTRDGVALRRIGKGQYHDVVTGELLVSSDPDAP
jgi:hypothetical protein